MEAVRSALELYAHAIAIEREAAERYAELSQYMQDLGNDAVAALFAKLGELESGHLGTLQARTQGLAVPELELDQFRWLDAGAPETAAREFVFRAMTPHLALEIALKAEQRAQEFFEHVYRTAADPSLRGLAQEMAMEEKEHVAMVKRLFDRTLDPSVDWTQFF